GVDHDVPPLLVGRPLPSVRRCVGLVGQAFFRLVRLRLDCQGRLHPLHCPPSGSKSVWFHGRMETMPAYVMLANWTDQGLKAIADGPRRVDAARKALEDMG